MIDQANRNDKQIAFLTLDSIFVTADLSRGAVVNSSSSSREKEEKSPSSFLLCVSAYMQIHLITMAMCALDAVEKEEKEIIIKSYSEVTNVSQHTCLESN